jgi:hypothetical protein
MDTCRWDRNIILESVEEGYIYYISLPYGFICSFPLYAKLQTRGIIHVCTTVKNTVSKLLELWFCMDKHWKPNSRVKLPDI